MLGKHEETLTGNFYFQEVRRLFRKPIQVLMVEVDISGLSGTLVSWDEDKPYQYTKWIEANTLQATQLRSMLFKHKCRYDNPKEELKKELNSITKD